MSRKEVEIGISWIKSRESNPSKKEEEMSVEACKKCGECVSYLNGR